MKKIILDQTMFLRAVTLAVRDKSHFLISMNFKMCLLRFDHVWFTF